MHEKMKFFIKDFFSKCDQIRTKLRRKLWIWSHAEEILSGKLFCHLPTVCDRLTKGP